MYFFTCTTVHLAFRKNKHNAIYWPIELQNFTARCAVNVFSFCLSGVTDDWWFVLVGGPKHFTVAWLNNCSDCLSFSWKCGICLFIFSLTRRCPASYPMRLAHPNTYPFISPVCFSCKTTIEAIHGLMSQVIKDKLFNQVNTSAN